MADVVIPQFHYDNLLNAVTTMLRVTEIYGETADEQFKSYMEGQVDIVKEALKHVPGAQVWDGKFHEEDVAFEAFRHDSQPDRSGPPVGVKGKHVPSGLSVESYSKGTAEENKRSVLRSLKGMVERDQPQQIDPRRGRRTR